MYLTYSAWAMRDLPVAEQIAIVRDCGYTGIELVSDVRGALQARTLDTTERRRIRRLLDDSGLTLTAIDGHGNLLQSDPAQRAEQVAGTHAAIDLAVDLAGPNGPPPVVCMAYGAPDRYEEQREAIAQNFLELAAYAAPRGVVVALEPHVGQAIDLPERVQWLMDRTASPHFRLNLDNSHFEVMGRRLDSYIDLLVPYSVHTHLKDQRGVVPNYEFLVPGEGDFDYVRYLRAMAGAGYDGPISVEISAMVQRRPDYDPAEVARRSFRTLTTAAQAAGVPLVYRQPAV